jgi:N-acetylglucosaminyl-diphospho-decaprenol L-rhamnosyltransferase
VTTAHPPVISVIVLNYNGRSWLGPCLDALAAQRDAPAFETILVDNASSDGSVSYVRQAYGDVRVHETGANLGFAGGNNAGARIARGRALVFLNNDTVAAPDWLARLHGAVHEQPDFALATSRIVSLDAPVVIDSAGDGYLRAGGAFKHGHGASPEDYAESREVFGVCGGAFIVRRDVFEELGGFDESFFMVYEDVDLSYRARLLGYRCWFAADAIVRHAVSGTLGRMSEMAVFHGQRNLEWTWMKNTPAPLLLRSLPAHLVYSMAGLAYYARRGALGPALRGKLNALSGLRSILRARRQVQRTRRVPSRSIEALMERRWLALKRREKHAMEG